MGLDGAAPDDGNLTAETPPPLTDAYLHADGGFDVLQLSSTIADFSSSNDIQLCTLTFFKLTNSLSENWINLTLAWLIIPNNLSILSTSLAPP